MIVILFLSIFVLVSITCKTGMNYTYSQSISIGFLSTLIILFLLKIC